MVDKLFPKAYFQDRRLMLMSGLMTLATIFTVVRTLITVRQFDYKVTVGYTQYGADSFELGEWYTLYEPAVFVLLSSIMVLMISFRLHQLDKKLSYLIITLQLVVLFFAFIVSGALLDASSIVS